MPNGTKNKKDPVLVNSSITGYWFNMLMQQLQLTETGMYGNVNRADTVGSISN